MQNSAIPSSRASLIYLRQHCTVMIIVSKFRSKVLQNFTSYSFIKLSYCKDSSSLGELWDAGMWGRCLRSQSQVGHKCRSRALKCSQLPCARPNLFPSLLTPSPLPPLPTIPWGFLNPKGYTATPSLSSTTGGSWSLVEEWPNNGFSEGSVSASVTEESMLSCTQALKLGLFAYLGKMGKMDGLLTWRWCRL